MKMNGLLIEHLGIQRVVVVVDHPLGRLNVPIKLVYGALKTGDLKNDIPDPAHRS